MISKICRTSITLLFAALLLAGPAEVAGQEGPFDIVIVGGRVIDPETGLDAIRNVGINGGSIAAISAEPLEGRRTIDASGLVVAPGFVDLHAHGQDLFSAKLQARDGVTTALELESGTYPVAEWYAEKEGASIINYGATVSHGGIRGSTMRDRESTLYGTATEDQIQAMADRVSAGLDAGALGVGFGIQYTPGASREEIFRLFQVAASHDVTNFVHIRYAGVVEPGSAAEAVHEMIANAASTGGSVHIVHIGSSGLGQAPLLLEMISGAFANGVDVTTEVYPYTAASTGLQSAIFDPGWQEKLGATYSDIEWVATGERLTEETFNTFRAQGGTIIAHVIPESTVKAALQDPAVLVASDGVGFVNGRAHPRGAGSFARVLGRYVREQATLSLPEAIAKMTLMPAQRLESAVPQMRRKGRVQVGSDADLTLFNPETVIDKATFAEPAQGSQGILYVMVGGSLVVENGELVEDARPGQAIRRPVPVS